jgi:predicted metal-dependent hydrolase
MNTNSGLIQVGSMPVLVVRKPIKNLHLSILPPLGKVRVSAPLHMKDEAIRILVATKITWIKKQKAKFEVQERQTRREYISGESHYFLGKRYRLEVIHADKPTRVSLNGKNKIILNVRPKSNRIRREEALLGWYRDELRTLSNELLSKWQNKIGVRVQSWGIKRMKTRWGTCNQKAGRIWLNLELIKKPIVHTEYVIIHELLHLIEKKHNKTFRNLMTAYLPKWQSLKEELNRLALSHEEWNY